MIDKTRFTVTQSEACELLGISRKTIRELEADGLPHAGDGKGKRYYLPEVFAWLRDRWDAGGSVASPALERWREARADSAEHDLAVKRGKFLPADKVTKFWSERILEARSALQSVGNKIAPQSVGLGVQQIHALIDGELRRICEGLARTWEASLVDENENAGPDAGDEN